MLHIDGDSYMVEVLHFAGMNNSAALQEQCIREGEAFILVYSVCERASFGNISRVHEQIMQVKSQMVDSVRTQTPIMVRSIAQRRDRFPRRKGGLSQQLCSLYSWKHPRRVAVISRELSWR